MVRQRWSEAGLNRRLAVVLLCAQAVLIVGSAVGFSISYDMPPGVTVAGVVIGTTILCIIPVALNGMVAWAVLFGSLRGRVFATLLSALAFLFWLPSGGWAGVAIAVVAVATIVFVWRHDEVAGAVDIRPATPLD